MICENQVFNLLTISDNRLIKKTFFKKPLKKLINEIYTKLDIPEESFAISLFYLHKLHKCIKLNNCTKLNNCIKLNNCTKLDDYSKLDNSSYNESIYYFKNNINIFIFTSIVLSLKLIYDENLNVKYLCNLFNINYKDFLETEIYILKNIDWKVNIDIIEYNNFKTYLEHYMDLPQLIYFLQHP